MDSSLQLSRAAYCRDETVLVSWGLRTGWGRRRKSEPTGGEEVANLTRLLVSVVRIESPLPRGRKQLPSLPRLVVLGFLSAPTSETTGVGDSGLSRIRLAPLDTEALRLRECKVLGPNKPALGARSLELGKVV